MSQSEKLLPNKTLYWKCSCWERWQLQRGDRCLSHAKSSCFGWSPLAWNTLLSDTLDAPLISVRLNVTAACRFLVVGILPVSLSLNLPAGIPVDWLQYLFSGPTNLWLHSPQPIKTDGCPPWRQVWLELCGLGHFVLTWTKWIALFLVDSIHRTPCQAS